MKLILTGILNYAACKSWISLYSSGYESSKNKFESMNQSTQTREMQTILFVEDERVILETVCEILTETGYEVLCAKDGVSACVLFDQQFDNIDMVIVDLTLPKRPGIEVIKHIRQNNKEIPILICSGRTETISNKINQESIQFLPKPYEISQMIEMIQTCLNDEA